MIINFLCHTKCDKDIENTFFLNFTVNNIRAVFLSISISLCLPDIKKIEHLKIFSLQLSIRAKRQ